MFPFSSLSLLRYFLKGRLMSWNKIPISLFTNIHTAGVLFSLQTLWSFYMAEWNKHGNYVSVGAGQRWWHTGDSGHNNNKKKKKNGAGAAADDGVFGWHEWKICVLRFIENEQQSSLLKSLLKHELNVLIWTDMISIWFHWGSGIKS